MGKVRNKCLGLVVLFLSVVSIAFASPNSKQIDSIFHDSLSQPNSPGFQLAVIKDGEIIYKKGYGLANIKSNAPMATHHILDLASTSKQFTAFCIALLLEDGRLRMEDEIHKFFPKLPNYKKGKILVEHLIYHQSGLKDYLEFMDDRRSLSEYDAYTVEDVLREMREITFLKFSPGEKIDYCNTNYLLLGEIVRRVTGKSLRQFADENIFKPLSMYRTFFHDNFYEHIDNLAPGYTYHKEGYIHDVSELTMVGDGNLYSNVEDFALWEKNFYNNRLGKGKQSLIDLTMKTGSLKNGDSTDYAFGLVIDDYRGYKMISHDGTFVGYSSAFVRFPDLRLAVVIFSNYDNIDVEDLALSVADLYIDDMN